MEHVGGFGTKIVIVAVSTFPSGFTIEKFADDKDPLMARPYEPFGYEQLYDGSIYAFDRAAPIEVDISVIPDTEDDINLKVLLQASKGGFSILPFDDSVHAVITYPNNGRVILSQGSILSGPILDNIVKEGRKESNTYRFVFSAVQGMQSTRQTVSGLIQGILGAL